MKALKGWISTGVLMAVIMFGTTAIVNAGVVYGVKSDDNQPCTITEKVDSGVVYGFTGVVYGFTGVVYGLTGVVYGLISTPPAECGK